MRLDIWNGPFLADSVQSGVTLTVPTFEGVIFKLNGAELPKDADKQTQTITIVPAPAELKVEARGTYLGRPVDQSEMLEASVSEEIGLDFLVKRAVSEEVANLLLNANVSWTKAYNAGNASLMTGMDPNGDAY